MNAMPNEYDGPRLSAKRLMVKQFNLDFVYAESATELDQVGNMNRYCWRRPRPGRIMKSSGFTGFMTSRNGKDLIGSIIGKFGQCV